MFNIDRRKSKKLTTLYKNTGCIYADERVFNHD